MKKLAILTYVKSSQTLSVNKGNKSVKLSIGEKAKRDLNKLAKKFIILIKK
jgi:hypothetical protein